MCVSSEEKKTNTFDWLIHVYLNNYVIEQYHMLHKKLEKKSGMSQPGIEPMTSRIKSGRSNH